MRISAKIFRRIFFREQWFVVLEIPMGEDLAPDAQCLIPVYPPSDRFWADPFVVSSGDKHFIFVEELTYASRKGHISVLEVSSDGKLISCQTVLERPYHLSYPFIFTWCGETYMLPESNHNRTIDVFRCVRFPNEWIYDRTLLSGIRAVDSTLIEHEGVWWLFCNQASEGKSLNECLYLYSAPTPLGPFSPHQGNPVVRNSKGSRPAGNFFSRGGVLYRPSQDCSRAYGEALIIHKVEEISADRYREREVLRIAPSRICGARRTHTLNESGVVRVMDALRWIRRS
jgi:hypothetical protein